MSVSFGEKREVCLEKREADERKHQGDMLGGRYGKEDKENGREKVVNTHTRGKTEEQERNGHTAGE
jgi:hypothetical protein